MHFLGIDPGNIESAYCLINDEEEILSFAKFRNFDYHDELYDIVTAPEIVYTAIESITGFGFKVGQTVFDTCFWSGRFFQFCESKSNVRLVPRKTIVLHFCNNTIGNDKAIREAMIYRHGGQGTKKNKGKTYGISKDCWSALAIATWLKDFKHEVENG